MPSFSSFQRKAENASAVSNKSNLVVQPKLTVNNPNDRYEQEADAVADSVMRMTTPSVSNAPLGVSRLTISNLQRKCAACEEKEKLQRKDTGNDTGGMAAPISVHETLTNSVGQSLDKNTQHFMESRFNRDFSQVRVHTSEQAAASASDIQARAYTSGNHIVFGKGEYQPHTEGGKRLLAHELVHTVQQQNNIIRRQSTGVSLPGSDRASCIAQINEDVAACCDTANTACSVYGASIAGAGVAGGALLGSLGLNPVTAGIGAVIGGVGGTVYGALEYGRCTARQNRSCREAGNRSIALCNEHFPN